MKSNSTKNNHAVVQLFQESRLGISHGQLPGYDLMYEFQGFPTQLWLIGACHGDHDI